jgi:cyanophycin synthetase
VARIEPPHVTGDGLSSVAELVDRVNQDPRRGDEGSGAPLYKLKIDDLAREVLAGQGWAPGSVPPAGKRILLRRNPPYIKNGGNLIDLTDCIHPSTAAHAVAAAQAVQLPVAGLDVVAADISKPLEDQGGVVVEINTSPGLWLHLAPWADSPRPVGQAIVDALFPPGHDGRIPVVALVGDATGAATRHLTALLTQAGLRVGSADPAEITVGQRRWAPQTRAPQERAGLLFQNPAVDVALLKTTPGELVRAGFASDRCDVAVLLDTRAPEDEDSDDVGPGFGEFLQALRHALAPEAVLVSAAGAASSGTALGLPPARTCLVAGPADLGRLRDHQAAGGRALLVQTDGTALVQEAEVIASLGKFPRSMPEREIPELLAALAAGLALGQGTAALQAYLCSLS